MNCRFYRQGKQCTENTRRGVRKYSNFFEQGAVAPCLKTFITLALQGIADSISKESNAQKTP